MNNTNIINPPRININLWVCLGGGGINDRCDGCTGILIVGWLESIISMIQPGKGKGKQRSSYQGSM